MTSLERASQLFHDFLSGHQVTYAFLIRKYGITRRTAHRWIRELRRALPLEERRNHEGRIVFRVDRNAAWFRSLVRLPLQDRDFTAIHKAMELLEAHHFEQEVGRLGRLRNTMDEALRESQAIEERKRRRKLPGLSESVVINAENMARTLGVAARPAPRVRVDPETDDSLRVALLKERGLRFDYTNAAGQRRTRRVSPVGILFGVRPCLVGRVEGYQNPVQFRLDRMENVRVLDDYRPVDGEAFDEYVRQLFGGFREEPIEVEWRFHPSAPEVDKWVFHPSQELVREEDGSVVVRFTAGGKDDMARHVIGWWDWIEVVKPDALRERVLQMKLAGLAPLLRQFAADDPDLADRVAALAEARGANKVPAPVADPAEGEEPTA